MTDARVDRLLTRAYARSLRTWRDGSWRIEYSGKEILREIGNRIFNRAVAPRSYQSRGSGFDVDLAKAVAAWQVANNAIPADLSDLLAALKARIAPSVLPS